MSGNARKTTGVIAVAAAVLVAVVAIFVSSKASWGESYISDNLSAQKIVLPEKANPDGSKNEEVAASECLTANAGKLMTTGAQAECYANDYIGVHMKNSTKEATLTSKAAIGMNEGATSLEGATYSTLGKFARGLDPSKATDATERKAIEADATMASGLRDSLYQGEMLRGTLLNAYGWSVVVGIAGTAVLALWLVAALLFLSGIVLVVKSRKNPHQV